MVRQIIHIDEEKCNGCGLCAEACHESAIAMIDGKAKLIRDDYCDGMGDCLPQCPTGAITFEMREAAAYDKEAVEKNMEAKKMEEMQKKMQSEGMQIGHAHEGGCPGARMRMMNRDGAANNVSAPVPFTQTSQLTNWPVQIKLAPVNAPYFDGAKLLIAADCTAFSYASFHEDFIKGRVCLIGCPKLDDIDYSEKLAAIISNNDIREVTIVRMEVPCCGGLAMAAQRALQESGKFIPWQIKTISIDGNILD